MAWTNGVEDSGRLDGILRGCVLAERFMTAPPEWCLTMILVREDMGAGLFNVFGPDCWREPLSIQRNERDGLKRAACFLAGCELSHGAEN
jgi:hypothetical protein